MKQPRVDHLTKTRNITVRASKQHLMLEREESPTLKTWHGCRIVLEKSASMMLLNMGIAADENILLR